MTSSPAEWDVEGPLQAEVFVVWLNGDTIELTGPCGPAPWMLELGAADHPLEVVDRIVRDALGQPLLVHSTSWRRDRGAVILSFLVVIDPVRVGLMDSRPIARTALARSEATAAPREIATDQVVEHALRHLAWLAEDDPAARETLSPAWRTVLTAYVPEPFRSLGQGGGAMSERTIRTRCACGWESAGPVERVVVATIEHGQRMHNMVASRDQVLERAELLDEGGGPAAGGSSSTATPGTPSATAGTSTGATGT